MQLVDKTHLVADVVALLNRSDMFCLTAFYTELREKNYSTTLRLLGMSYVPALINIQEKILSVFFSSENILTTRTATPTINYSSKQSKTS